MAECSHKFKGHANGVSCILCGLRMSAKEYAEYLTTPEEPEATEEPRRGRKKKEG